MNASISDNSEPFPTDTHFGPLEIEIEIEITMFGFKSRNVECQRKIGESVLFLLGVNRFSGVENGIFFHRCIEDKFGAHKSIEMTICIRQPLSFGVFQKALNFYR